MWKVKGDKALMLFVFVKEHKARIQVGYGLEGVITDAYSSRVIRNAVVPNFQRQQYAAGLNAAIDQLASKVDPNFPATRTASSAVQQQRPISRSTPGPSGSDIVILGILFLVFLFVILPLLRRGGGCGGCGGCLLPMFWGGGGGGSFDGGGSWGGGDSSFGGGGAGGSW